MWELTISVSLFDLNYQFDNDKTLERFNMFLISCKHVLFAKETLCIDPL